MFKKIGMVTALSAALLFGGTFQQSVEASANEQTQIPLYKIYYSINGNWGNVSGDQVNNLLTEYLKKYNILWSKINWNNNCNTEEGQAPSEDNVGKPEAPVEKPDQPVEQPEAPVEKPDQPVEQPEAPVEKPDQPVEQPEAPVEKPEAPVEPPTETDKEEETNDSQSEQLNQFEQEVFELTNQERAKSGLQPLKVDAALSKVAREKSRDMAANNYFSHDSPTYGSPFDMMKQFGITYRTAGENIAKGQRTPEEVVNAWMNSEGHRVNILSSKYTHIGIGYVEQGNHWTQQFIGK